MHTEASARAGPGPGASEGYLATLDGWRAVAIALVVFDHALNSSACAAGSLHWCNRIMVGQSGVNLFFGISGFLICWRLLEERRRTGRISLSAFYLRRAFRILPPALLYLAILVALALGRQILLSRTELEASLLFYRNALSPEAGFYTGHFWSLSIEEQFYLVWPTLLLGLLLLRPRPRVAAVVCLAVLVAVWRHASVALALMSAGQLDRGFFLHTMVRTDGLLLGAAWALALAPDPRLLERVTVWWWAAALGAYLAIVTHFGLRPTIWESALVPVLITWTARHPASAPGRLLESPPMRWLGRLSYSLYIWQQFFFPPAHLAAPARLLQRWPLAVPAALACAVASYYLLERPALRLGHRLARRSAAPRDAERRPQPSLGTAAV